MTPILKPENKVKNIALWILQVLVALAFLGAGFAKLTGQPAMVEIFSHIGIGQWFRYVTGAVEVVSAILLLVPRLVPVGALLLVATMVGAFLTQIFVIGATPVPAVVLLILAALIAWGRKDRIKALV